MDTISHRGVVSMKPYNELKSQDKKDIISMYYENHAFTDISEHLNVSRRSVSRVLKEASINTRLKNRYTLNESYFETIDTEKKAYWLGFLYADGYVGNNNYNNVVLSSIDQEHIQKFSDDIEYTGNLRKRVGGFEGSKEQLVINFSSEKMTSDLRNIGLYPGKSTTMESFPEIDSDLVNHFIRGYFDGDGSVYEQRSTSYHKDKMYEYQRNIVSIIGTYKFLMEILEHLPMMHRIRKSKTESMFYIEYYGRHDFEDIYDYLYKNATIYLDRKFNKFETLLAPLKSNFY